MEVSLTISIVSLFISLGAFALAIWRVYIARRTADLSRFEALLKLEQVYLTGMQKELDFVKSFGSNQESAREAAQREYAKIGVKLNQVRREIEPYHEKLVK